MADDPEVEETVLKDLPGADIMDDQVSTPVG